MTHPRTTIAVVALATFGFIGEAAAQMVTPGVGVGIPNGLSGGTVAFTPAPVAGADLPAVGPGVAGGRHRARHPVARTRPGVLSDQRR